MTLKLCVLTPNRIILDSEVKEIILSTNSGQIGVLPNHTPIATALDIGLLRIHINDQWLKVALMGGFARIGNNEIILLKCTSAYPAPLEEMNLRLDCSDFTGNNVIRFYIENKHRLESVNKNIKVAVMGCAVNGPGEAREADIGIAGGNGEGLIFKKGLIVRKVKEENLIEELMKEIENM